MCNLETEGTKHACGHYAITRKVRKIDCNSPYCTHSTTHRLPCNNCDYHEKFLGPDSKETITRISSEVCDQCTYWTQDRRLR